MFARKYSNEEKRAYIEEFKVSGLNKTKFAREKGIPEATFRGWLKFESLETFGEIDLKKTTCIYAEPICELNPLIEKTIIFKQDNINLELREGYNKQLLKKIVEVLVSDT